MILKNKHSRRKNRHIRTLTSVALVSLTLLIFIGGSTLTHAAENNIVENNDNFTVSESPTDSFLTEAEVNIALIDSASGEIKISSEKILLKDIDIDIKNLDIYLSDIQLDENSLSEAENSFRTISNQFSSDNGSGSGNPFSFSTTGHYFQLRNLNFKWRDRPDENLEVGLSYDNQKLIIQKPIVTTGTPLGYATLSFGTISQGADKFSVSGSAKGIKNLRESTLESAAENFNIKLVKPSLFFFTPILGTHSFTLTDNHIDIKGVSTFGEILKQRKINADVNVSRQETNLKSLNPTDNIISISIIKLKEKSVSLEAPSPYDKFLLKNVNWHYDSIDQSLENLDAKFKDVSISYASLENSSVRLKRLDLNWKNPRFSIEIPFLGISSIKSKQIPLDNLKMKLENLDVKSMRYHKKILDNVQFKKFTAIQDMSRLGKFEITLRGLKGTTENLTIIQPNISLSDPGFLGFEMNMDKLNLEEPTESNITKASVIINLPGSSKMIWSPRALNMPNSQTLLSSFLLLGVLLFYKISARSKSPSDDRGKD